MRRILILTFSLSAVIAAIYGWRAIADQPVILAAVPGPDPLERDRLIGVFEVRVASPDPEPFNLSVLGGLYLERARSEHNLDDYTLARDTLQQAARVLNDSATLLNLADSHLALHEFASAREIVSRLAADDPTDSALATLADAELALGNYPAAFEALDHLAERLPDEPAILVRRAQYHFLTGDIDEALRLSERAADLAVRVGLSSRDQAFYLSVAGRMNFEAGKYRPAQSRLTQAMEADPQAPGPLFELGKVMAARNDLPAAIRLLELAAALVPEPTTLAWLGDVYLANGDGVAATAQYETIEAIALLDQSAYRLSVASALAGRGLNPSQALELSTAELSVRPDPTTWDVYAVTLLNTGETAESYHAIQKALGPADARIWYHAGLIAAAIGRVDEAVEHLEAALRINPNFHPLDAPRARQLLEELSA